MKKTLALAVALSLTGIPSIAAQFETPAGGELRVIAPVSAAAPVQGADLSAALSVPPQIAIPAGAGVVIPELAAKAAQAASARPSARAKASPRAELSASEHGGAVAFASLADGGKGASAPSEAVAGALSTGLITPNLGRYSGDGSYSPREPRRPREDVGARTALQRAWQRVKDVPQGWKIGVAAAVIVSATLLGFYEHSRHWNDFWKHSKSQNEIVRIDEARRDRDAQELVDIAKEAQARQQRMLDRINAAKAEKHKRVEDKTHDTVKEAENLAAYDGLVWSRARLNHNFVSEDPKARLGEETPTRWTSHEAQLEQDAVASGFEGRLALSLKSLGDEVQRERGWSSAIDGQLKTFDKHVPSLFGGALAGESKKGQADLKEFGDKEISPEAALLAAKTGAMRGRVSDRLYSERQDYRGHRDRRDRLSSLFDAKVDPAYQTAKGIDDDLSSMISHRNSEATYMVMASMHTHDYAGESCDSDGKNCHAVYEDNSGIYRALAASEASSAAADARSANAGLERLKPMISVLYADRTLGDEQLRGLLPKAQGQKVGEGDFHIIGDLMFHPLIGIFGSLGSASSGESARSSFGPVLGALRALDGEVAGRRDGEIRWVEGQITTDLDAQMKKALEQTTPEAPAKGW